MSGRKSKLRQVQIANQMQASINSKDIDLVSEARMKCEDYNDKLIAQMIESETYREWYMVETNEQSSESARWKHKREGCRDWQKLKKK